MNIKFYKYHGTGNDFIMIDNLSNKITLTEKQINFLCDRHFGIGADGLILIEPSEKHDYYMRYFNADGKPSSMCGNGGRCSVHFAKYLGAFNNNSTKFDAVDGIHKATINQTMVALEMQDVLEVETYDTHSFLNTGSPHHITIVPNTDSIDVYNEGKKIRYGKPYHDKGTNVNFVEHIDDNVFKMRTYERGVEAETLSCGTGATATAIAMYNLGITKKRNVILETLGGRLEVSFEKEGAKYKEVILKGPTTFVFKGKISI